MREANLIDLNAAFREGTYWVKNGTPMFANSELKVSNEEGLVIENEPATPVPDGENDIFFTEFAFTQITGFDFANSAKILGTVAATTTVATSIASSTIVKGNNNYFMAVY